MTKYCEQNVYIEEIVLSGNNKIHSPEVEEIDNQCRMNMLIKKYILPNLKLAKDTGFKSNKNARTCLTIGSNGYDVTQVKFKNESYKTADFVFKFIRICEDDLMQLKLQHVYTDDHLVSLTEFFKQPRTKTIKLTALWLENCPLSEKDIQDIIKAVGKFGGLERLHLINMQHIQKALPLIK